MSIKTIWTKVKSFVTSMFVRSDRIEIASSVANALNSFAETQADDIIVYILNAVWSGTSTVTDIIEDFLEDDLPTLLKALEMLDASDETAIAETNINAVVSKVKEFCSTVDITTLTAAVTAAMEKKDTETEGKLTISEAKEILSNYVK